MSQDTASIPGSSVARQSKILPRMKRSWEERVQNAASANEVGEGKSRTLLACLHEVRHLERLGFCCVRVNNEARSGSKVVSKAHEKFSAAAWSGCGGGSKVLWGRNLTGQEQTTTLKRDHAS